MRLHMNACISIFAAGLVSRPVLVSQGVCCDSDIQKHWQRRWRVSSVQGLGSAQLNTSGSDRKRRNQSVWWALISEAVMNTLPQAPLLTSLQLTYTLLSHSTPTKILLSQSHDRKGIKNSCIFKYKNWSVVIMIPLPPATVDFHIIHKFSHLDQVCLFNVPIVPYISCKLASSGCTNPSLWEYAYVFVFRSASELRTSPDKTIFHYLGRVNFCPSPEFDFPT